MCILYSCDHLCEYQEQNGKGECNSKVINNPEQPSFLDGKSDYDCHTDALENESPPDSVTGVKFL